MSQRINRYKVGERIGHGAMGEVFQAYDTQTEREVAIKMLPARTLKGSRLERFKLEARTIARIEHPFVVPLYDFNLPDTDEPPFLVMRYMRGGTLADRIQQGDLSVHEIAQITRRIAAALDAAHERNLVHRDLKPSNILLDQDGYSYLSDFGIVKDITDDESLTMGGQPGTAYYMSPEQITGKRVDARSDIYSLGVLIFEMLTGRKPFQGNLNTIFQGHIFEEVPRVYQYTQNMPDEVDDVLRRAMAKQPEDRYTKASQLAYALEAALQSPSAYMRARSAIESHDAEDASVSLNVERQEIPQTKQEANRRFPAEEQSAYSSDAPNTPIQTVTYLNYPLDYVPSPKPVPPHSRISYRHNPAFVGRSRELQTLAQHLKNGQVTIISGLGGIGKTQLSVEFVHRYGHYFVGGVFWMNFADAENVPAEVAACGGMEGLNLMPKFDQLDLEDQVLLVQQVWQQPMPRLLIFDNCEDKSLLEKWWPTTGGCRVIVTSRQTRWSRIRNVANLTLAALPAVDGVQLLQKYVPDLLSEVAETIAAELGHLPLALHLAGSFLERYQGIVSPAAYIDQIRHHGLEHPSLTGRGAQYSPTEHELHVARTFGLSYEKLHSPNEVDKIALKLLARAACFSPGDPIPRQLLLKTIDLAEEDLDAVLLAEDGFARLQALGLATQGDDKSVWLHRLVAKFVQQASQETKACAEVEFTVSQRAKHLNQKVEPQVIRVWQTHLRYIVDQAFARQSEHAAQLAHELGNYLRLTGSYEEAYIWLERAWRLREQHLGPTHLETARSLNDMGIVQAEMGQFDLALLKVTEAMNIRQEQAPDEADTAESYSNMGHILQSLGQFDEAQAHMERALTIYDHLAEAAPQERAQSLNNLGVVFLKTGDLNQAHDCFEQARATWVQSLGSEHPLVANAIVNLGTIAWASGDFVAAKQCFAQGVQVLKESVGEWHPLTATAYNNLGAALRELDEFDAAQLHTEKALTIFQELEPAGINQVNSLRNLGLLYQKRQELDLAQELFEQALAAVTAWQESHQVVHPLAAQIANHLASLPETVDK